MDADDLELVIAHTGHARFEKLTADDYPDVAIRDGYRRRVSEMAARIRDDEASGPSFPTKVFNFARSVVNHALDGLRDVEETTRQARLAICGGCASHRDGKCDACGCPVAIKARWASESCPRGLWAATDPARECGTCGD